MKTRNVDKMLATLLLFSVFTLLPPAAAATPPPQPIFQFEPLVERGMGDVQNNGVWGMEWWKGMLYVGTVRSWYCFSQAWFHIQYPNLWNWPPVPPHQCAQDVRDLPLQAEIWRYTPETDSWEMLYRSPEVEIPGEPGHYTGRDIGYRTMTVFQEQDGTEALYVGGVTANLLWQPLVPPRILRSVDGTTFELIPQDPGTLLGDLGTSEASFRSLTPYNGRLYVINGEVRGNGRVLEAENPELGNDSFRWITPEDTDVFEIAVYNNSLYLGLADPKGYSVVKTQANGSPPYKFETVVPRGGNRIFRPSNSVVSMHVFDDRLYVGMNRPCEIIRINPDDSWDLVIGKPRWTRDGYKRPLSGLGDGFGYSFNYHIWRMQAHEGVLYVGTFDETMKWIILLQYQDRPALNTLLEYMVPRAGFDLFATTDGYHFTRLTTDGFGNLFDQGIRNFASTPQGLFIGDVNTVQGLMLWRGVPEPSVGSTPDCVKPAPPQRLEVERVIGLPLLTWDPTQDGVRYRIFRSDIGTKFHFEEIGSTETPFFTDAEAGLFGQQDYYVVAEDASGVVSESSNMVSFPPKNEPVTFMSMTQTFRKWKASMDMKFKLFVARSSVRNGEFAVALRQLEEMTQEVFLDPSMASWRAEDSAILLTKLARRVVLAELGVLSTNNVLWGFQIDPTPSRSRLRRTAR